MSKTKTNDSFKKFIAVLAVVYMLICALFTTTATAADARGDYDQMIAKLTETIAAQAGVSAENVKIYFVDDAPALSSLAGSIAQEYTSPFNACSHYASWTYIGAMKVEVHGVPEVTYCYSWYYAEVYWCSVCSGYMPAPTSEMAYVWLHLGGNPCARCGKIW